MDDVLMLDLMMLYDVGPHDVWMTADVGCVEF